MRVYLTVAVPFEHQETLIPVFEELTDRDRFGAHCLTDDPEKADLILFVDPHQIPGDWRLRLIRRHPLARKYPRKVMVYDERDHPWGALPGLYVSLPRYGFDVRRQRACAYSKNLNETIRACTMSPDLLFSFMGGRTHPVRSEIFQIVHARAHTEDTTQVSFFVGTDSLENAAQVHAQKTRFADVVCRSKFVLCPRGHGTSSIRLYETLSAGRVPVILSDAWVPPHGPDWENCSLRVREADVAALPSLLEAAEPRYEEMACAARRVYADWFAPDVRFHRMMEECQELLRTGQAHKRSFMPDRQYLRLCAREIKAKARQQWQRVRGQQAGRGEA